MAKKTKKDDAWQFVGLIGRVPSLYKDYSSRLINVRREQAVHNVREYGIDKALRIAVVGHRNLGTEATTRFVTEQCLALLKRAQAEHGQVAALSALADGADTIFAETALTLGIPLDIVRPFDEFASDFTPASVRSRYEALRAAAAVKLGALLQDCPSEWHVSLERQNQLIHLTKQVLAAALAIEGDTKVLKALTIAIALHHPWKNDTTASNEKRRFGDLRGLDLSGAKAVDAYWARIDFSPRADFYRADLSQASFRQAILREAQFRESNLKKAVLVAADCTEANFKQTDLRGNAFPKGQVSDEAHLVQDRSSEVSRVLTTGNVARLESALLFTPVGQ